MALRRAMAWTPTASVIVRTAGRPSGMAATDSPTTAMNISENAKCPTKYPKTSNMAATNRMNTVSHRANTFICRTSGVVSTSTVESMPLIRPISVCAPVATTTPRPVPLVTSVPL